MSQLGTLVREHTLDLLSQALPHPEPDPDEGEVALLFAQESERFSTVPRSSYGGVLPEDVMDGLPPNRNRWLMRQVAEDSELFD